MIDTKILEQIARRLCDGRPVFVRRQVPTRSGADGQCTKSSAGAWFVDLRPGLTEDQERYVILHECGHIRAGHIEKPNDEDAHGRPSSAPMTKDLPLNRYQRAALERREAEADQWAAAWQAWIDAHGGSLASLLDWWPPEYEQAIEAGVGRAFQKLGLRRVNR